jgi:serine/threonine-protein kinase
MQGLPRIFERFTLLRRIARGGMGEVFLATAGGIEGAERPVVIKIIRKDHDTDSSFLARFLDEARIQSQLHHPGVAQILEASTDSAGKPYVVVEYVEGRNLGDVRGRAAQLGVRIEWPEAIAVALTIGEALTHVHERTDADGRPLDIVHRDLSPQNVMVGYGGDVKLIDFGTARGENRRCHTVSGIVFAKPGYVAPEVANNTPGGVPADLYAFGVMLWELLAGRRFLVGEPSAHLAAVGAGKKALPPIAQSVGAPLELDTVIACLTALRVEDRYASARQAAADLVRLLQRAPSRSDGDRSVRGRITQLMQRLYPAEPVRSRADFQALVTAARSAKAAPAPVLLPPSPVPPENDELLPGTRYRLDHELGRGAMGVVYAATHLDLGREVALKVLDREFMGGDSRGRFVAEARAVARITHEGLVQLHEFGFTSDGRPFYAMELVNGEPLDRKLAAEGPLAWRDAVALAIKTANAAEAAHACGVVHRDIKPHNLLATHDGGVKLLDFGVAKRVSELEPSAADDLDALSVIGTPEYMAPEQARGSADARSDVYALGATLYELITGSLPHHASSTAALIERKLASAPDPASVLAPAAELPRELDRVLQKAMMPEPDARFEDMTAFRVALERVLDGRARSQRVRRAFGATLVGVVSLAAFAAVGSGTPLLRDRALPALAGLGRSALGHAERALEAARAARSTVAVAPAASPKSEALPAMTAAALVAPPAVPTFGEDTEVAQPGAVAATAPETNAAPASDAPSADSAPPTTASGDSVAASDEEIAPASSAPEASSEAATHALAEFKTLSEKGRKLKALAGIRVAARSFPRDPAVLKAYVQAAEGSKAFGEAHRAAERWVEVDQSSAARLTLARLERATGNSPKALAILDSVLKADPESPEAHRLATLWSRGDRLALNR